MTFELQHSDIPQPKLLDQDPVTEKWPLPPVKRWEPKPKRLSPYVEARYMATAWIEKHGIAA